MTVRAKAAGKSSRGKRGPDPESIFSASLAFSDRHQYRHLMPNRAGETVLEKFRGDVYACIRLRAIQVAKIPLRVYVETRGGHSQKHRARWRCRKLLAHEVRRAKSFSRAWKDRSGGDAEFEEVPDHPLAVALQKINPWGNRFQAWEGTQTYLDLLGDAYWYISRDRRGSPAEFYPLLSQYVTVVPGEETPVKGYLYGRRPEEMIPLLPEEVIHFRMSSPFSMIRGRATLAAAMVQESLQTGMLDWQNTLVLNNAVGEWAIVSKNKFKPEEKQKVQKQIYDAHRGPYRQGNLLFLDGGEVDLKPLAVSPKEMGFLAGIKVVGEQIFRVFGVPKALVDNEAMPRANMDSAQALFLDNTMGPILSGIEETLNQDLVPMFDDTGRLFVAFDNPIPDDHEFRRTVIQTVPTAFLLNEVRDLAGMPPDETLEGKFAEVRPTASPLVLDRRPTTTKAALRKETIPPVRDAGDPVDAVRGMARACRNYFSEQEAHVMERAEDLLGKGAAWSVKGLADMQQQPPFDREAWDRRFADMMAPYLKRSMFRGAVQAAQEIGIDLGGAENIWLSEDPGINLHVRQYGERLAHLVNETTDQRLRESMERVRASLPAVGGGLGADEGTTMRAISEEVASVFGNARDYRSDRIAQTETLRASNEVRLQSFKANGIAEVEWAAGSDACPFCATMDGRRVATGATFADLGETMRVFVEGGEGDQPEERELRVGFDRVAAPPLHPNCMCTCVGVVPEFEE